MVDVFPRRNLGEDADPWGRAAENRIIQAEKRQDQIDQSVGNFGRLSGSQLEVLSRQVNELSARGIDTFDFPTASVTGSATTAPFPVGSSTLTIPGRANSRAALLGFSCGLDESPGTGSGVYVEILVGGEVVAKASGARGTQKPDGWSDYQVNVLFSSIIPAGGAAITLRLTRIGFTTTASTWTSSSGLLSVYYGDRVD